MLVWDTSAVWSAIEPLEWGLRGVAKDFFWRSEKGAPTDIMGALRGRLTRLEPTARALMFECTQDECIIPSSVRGEIRRKGRETNFEIFFDQERCRELEMRYNVPGFCKNVVNRFRFREEKADVGEIEFVRKKAQEKGIILDKPYERGQPFLLADYEPIAIALRTGATLVTGDKRQAELARELGVPVIYIFEGSVQIPRPESAIKMEKKAERREEKGEVFPSWWRTNV